MRKNGDIPARERRWLNEAIDVSIREEVLLSELLGDVCEEADYFRKYMSEDTPSRPPEELLAFVRARLSKRLLRGEIFFERDGGGKLSSTEAIALLNESETWKPTLTREGNYVIAVHIWSYDHREPLTIWLRYWIRSKFRRLQS